MSKKLVLAMALMASVPAVTFASTDSKDLTMIVTVLPSATLTVIPPIITFTPLGSTSPTAADLPVVVTADALTGPTSSVTLTALANGDLLSGPDTIPVNKVSWTASGAGFVGGTMSKVAPQSVGSWTGSGLRIGTLNFTLAAGAYGTGLYTQTATFVLTAP